MLTTNSDQLLKSRRFATVKQTAEIYPAITQSGLRWLIFNQKTNGFNSCIRRLGRKILIDLDLFEKWIDFQEAGV